MKLSRLLVLFVPLFLAACGLSDQQKADYARVQQSGVSSAVYDKMMHGDDLSLYDIKALSRAHVSDGAIAAECSRFNAFEAEDVEGRSGRFLRI